MLNVQIPLVHTPVPVAMVILEMVMLVKTLMNVMQQCLDANVAILKAISSQLNHVTPMLTVSIKTVHSTVLAMTDILEMVSNVLTSMNALSVVTIVMPTPLVPTQLALGLANVTQDMRVMVLVVLTLTNVWLILATLMPTAVTTMDHTPALVKMASTVTEKHAQTLMNVFQLMLVMPMLHVLIAMVHTVALATMDTPVTVWIAPTIMSVNLKLTIAM